MQARNLDFEIPLTREQWQQLGETANQREDYGVLRWAPAEFDVIRISAHSDDAPLGWEYEATPRDVTVGDDREVARFVYNDGRPFARLDGRVLATPGPGTPTDAAMSNSLERWVRDKWHMLLRDSGIHYDRGALPADEPNPPR
jgi:hypothetical protein